MLTLMATHDPLDRCARMDGAGTPHPPHDQSKGREANAGSHVDGPIEFNA